MFINSKRFYFFFVHVCLWQEILKQQTIIIPFLKTETVKKKIIIIMNKKKKNETMQVKINRKKIMLKPKPERMKRF